MPLEMSSAIHNQAINKAFAKITILGFDINRLKKDIRTGNTGGITENELMQVLDGTKKEKPRHADYCSMYWKIKC